MHGQPASNWQAEWTNTVSKIAVGGACSFPGRRRRTQSIGFLSPMLSSPLEVMMAPVGGASDPACKDPPGAEVQVIVRCLLLVHRSRTVWLAAALS